MSAEVKRFLLSDMTAKDWAEFDAFMEAKRRMVELRKKNPYIVDLMRVLWPHNVRGLSRMDAVNAVYMLRHPKGLATVDTFADKVQSVFNQNNRDSAACKRKIIAPFYSVSRGIWGINRHKAIAWLEKHERLLVPSKKITKLAGPTPH